MQLASEDGAQFAAVGRLPLAGCEAEVAAAEAGDVAEADELAVVAGTELGTGASPWPVGEVAKEPADADAALDDDAADVAAPMVMRTSCVVAERATRTRPERPLGRTGS